MKPPDLQLPWPEWRKGQWEVIALALASDKRYVLIEAPPGIGKSGIALAISRVLQERTHVLTGTIQLQQQYAEMPGVTQVLGRPNFNCLIQPSLITSEGPCTAGMKCEYSGSKGLPGCEYFDQKRVATAAQEVVFNYAYWLRQINYAGWRPPGVLVCDEAHTLANQVRSFAQVVIRRSVLTFMGIGWPREEHDFYWWRAHAREMLSWPSTQSAFFDAEHNPPHETDYEGQRRACGVLAFRDAVRTIAHAEDDWIIQPQAWGWEFKPVWVHTLVPRYVLKHATEKVIFLSATILNKEVFCGLNGIPEGEAEYIAAGSTFARQRRPLVYRPVGRVNRNSDQSELIGNMRTILSREVGRGLVHTVSHRLAGEIAEHFKDDPRVITHDAGRDRLRALDQFKRTPGAVLISPSMHTGVDLPYDLCRFQIICKLPFPDMGDPLVKAQMKNATRDNPLDKGQRAYTYDTAATLVQTYGRIMRAEDDSGTTYLLDGNYKWFRHAAREFLPQWFTEAVKWESDGGVNEADVLRELRSVGGVALTS